VARSEDEHVNKRAKRMNVAQTNPKDVLPLRETNLTVANIAEKLGISVEDACALIAAALRSSHARSRQRNPL
jgi:hypothetical protein